MPSKRGNPNWGRPLKPLLDGPNEFEKQMQLLGLTKQTCVDSTELRRWCERNKDRHYIPEWLLKEWRIPVDPNVT